MPMVITEGMTVEQLREQIVNGNEEINALTQERDNHKAEKEKADIRIRELQDKNQDLFLKITHTEEKQEEQKDEGSSLDKFINTLLGGDK